MDMMKTYTGLKARYKDIDLCMTHLMETKGMLCVLTCGQLDSMTHNVELGFKYNTLQSFYHRG